MRSLVTVLAFLLALPVSLFAGFTFVLGHAAVLPYVSVWWDRAMFALVALGIPVLAAFLVHRAMGGKRAPGAEDRKA